MTDKITTALASVERGGAGDLVRQFGGDFETFKAQALAMAASPNAAALMKCAPTTIVNALMTLAELGLSPSPAHNHYYLVPYDNQLQVAPSWRGLTHLAYRTGKLISIDSAVLYRSEYDAMRAQGLPLFDPDTKRPNFLPFIDEVARDEFEDADIVGAAAWAEIRGRDVFASRFLSRGKIEKRREAGKKKADQKQPAWSSWFEEMARAKALKALLTSADVPLADFGSVQEVLARDEPETIRVTATAKPIETPPETTFEKRDRDPLPGESELHAERLADANEALGGLDDEAVSAYLINNFDEVELAKLSAEQLEKVKKAASEGAIG